MTIPIRNLYYLFSYAWQRFPEGQAVDVGVDDAPDVPNLFARILISGANRLMRRGLDRGYQAFIEETRSPRGRMMLDAIIKGQTLRRGAVICAFDDLTADVLHNQIIKATARCLASAHGVERAQVHDLGLIVRRMAGVSDIRLSRDAFKRIQLSRNTSQYRPLMKLCELVFRAQLPSERGEGSRFADILEDETIMSAVFEDFLRNFYGHEQSEFKVAREVMSWDAEPMEEASNGYLPIMETDITLRSKTRTVVMDAKFYKDVLVARVGAGKVRSGHLYQLFAYLEHAALRAPALPCDGALIYPASGPSIALRYRLRGHEVVVRSVDFTRDWRAIHDELLAIPTEFGRPASGTIAHAELRH